MGVNVYALINYYITKRYLIAYIEYILRVSVIEKPYNKQSIQTIKLSTIAIVGFRFHTNSFDERHINHLD